MHLRGDRSKRVGLRGVEGRLDSWALVGLLVELLLGLLVELRLGLLVELLVEVAGVR